MDLGQTGDRLTETVAASQADGATPDVPPQFIQDLFGRVPAEDLAPYAPGDLAEIAAAAYAHLSAARTAGVPDIRLIDFEVERAGRRRDITVLEVVNDNMPFLLDSTLAELAEQGGEPLLVAHPILAVERDRSGALVRRVAEATAAADAMGATARKLHSHPSQPDRRSGGSRAADQRPRTGLRRCGCGRAGLAGDACAHRRHRAELPPNSAAARARRGRRSGRFSRMAGRRQFHLPRRAGIPPPGGRRGRRPGAGVGPRPPARPVRARAAPRARTRRDDARRCGPSWPSRRRSSSRKRT